MPKIKYAATSSWKKYICRATSATAAHQTHFGTRLILIRILTPALLDASRGPNESFANPSLIHQLRARIKKPHAQIGKRIFRECDSLCRFARRDPHLPRTVSVFRGLVSSACNPFSPWESNLPGEEQCFIFALEISEFSRYARQNRSHSAAIYVFERRSQFQLPPVNVGRSEER